MNDTPPLTDLPVSIEERQTKALESIAYSLACLAHPPMKVSDHDAEMIKAAMKRGPGSITYVDRFGRPTPQPDRTA